jgi:hypothetical protein
VDDSALLCLCQLCDNDVRSAINNMQFVVSSGRVVTRDLLVKLNLSAAASSHNFFRDISALLLYRAPAGVSAAQPSRFAGLYDLTSAANHDGVLTDGLFTNYLSLPFSDSPMERASRMADWFCFYDSLQTEISLRQHFELLALVPILGVAASTELGLANNPSLRQLRDLRFPGQKEERWRADRDANLALVREHLAGLRGPVLAETGLASATSFVQEHLPAIISTLDPLGPQAFPVLSRLSHPAQPELLSRLAEGFRHYGLDYAVSEPVPFKKGSDARFEVFSSLFPSPSRSCSVTCIDIVWILLWTVWCALHQFLDLLLNHLLAIVTMCCTRSF